MTRKRAVQFYLPTEQIDRLTRLARRKGTTRSNLLRTAVNQLLADAASGDDPIFGIIGLGRSGEGNTSEEHDRVLGEIESDRWRRDESAQEDSES